ncbi:MAG: hypothetical protein U1E40_14445 [Amaricoccus sp.]
MNVRAAQSATARVIPLPLVRRRLAEASIVPIAPEVTAILFDSPPERGASRQRLTALFAGQPLVGPSISTSLELRSGGRRHLLVVGRGAAALTGTTVTLALGARLAAILDGDWLQPPIADGAALVRGLSEEGRRRLLKLFMTTGASLFGRGSPGFAAAARRLAETVAAAALAPASWCPLGAGARLVSWRLAADLADAVPEELIALASDRVARLDGWQAMVETAGTRRILHLCLPAGPAGETTLVGLGPAQVHLRVPGADLPPQPLAPWLARRGAEVAEWAAALLAARAASDPIAAALARELRQACRAPRATLRHLSATPAGLLFAAELDDPEGLVRALRFERGGAAVEVAAGPSATGFAALPPGDRCRLSLVHWSGRLALVHEGVPAAVAHDVPEALAADPAAVAHAWLGLPGLAATGVESFGTSADPLLAIVAPVPANLDLIRARAAAVFAEPKGRAIELVYHVRPGPLASAARAAIALAEAVYGIPHRLVTLPPAATDTDALRAAIEAATAPRLLALGAEVLPAEPGWLAAWLTRLDSSRPLLGGALLDIAGSALDLGGWPVRDLPRRSPATPVSAACVGLTREAVRRLDEMPHYPEPDVTLAAIAATLGREGRAPHRMPQTRFVRHGGGTPRSRLAAAVDSAALQLLLNPSFRPGGDEGRP